MASQDFNPRPRKEGDFFSIIFCVSSYSDFNPRPRKEGDIGVTGVTKGV